ncbi:MULTISPECIES: hypothetical protein [Microbispora]|jgi:hypothetical protein|uniref:Uncharacterized protein n=1 Tax=Microbispora rosea TaxID=58117 RepID=A0A1N7GTJ5_9ACTN|nr:MULTISPECIES: hypothetical protein [Microbispora]GIH51439.1 hypothetical protein Mro03_66180 [Microbispora rosea subsp. rosea]GLX07675.1 hypothetical protein Misp03_46010 [Microbispora sp. NBRC 16548]SIS15886.1 hypothetical protein SAMN05421833_13267 [Microbispora rosea]
MGRILLIAAAVIVGFFLLGSVIGLIFGALKWVLIIGAIALIVSVVLKLTRSSRSNHYS